MENSPSEKLANGFYSEVSNTNSKYGTHLTVAHYIFPKTARYDLVDPTRKTKVE